MRIGMWGLPLVVAVAMALVLVVVVEAQPAKAATAPHAKKDTGAPVPPKPPRAKKDTGAPVPPMAPPGVRILSREEKIQRRFESLARAYTLRMESPDWILRCLAVISMARLPTEEATATLIERLERESKPVGKLVVWQALLSRASQLSPEQFDTWQKQTGKMQDDNLFNGDLRIGLLEMLSATPLTPESRRTFQNLFKTTNSLDSGDIPTLIAMGRALKAWGDAALVDQVLRGLGSPSTAVRAELILQAAGVEVPWTRTPKARQVYAEWWKANRDAFTASEPTATGWKRLKPQFVWGPVDPKTIDLADTWWHDELELGHLQLQNFDFALAVDCSRSMRPEIERLKRDMAIMVAAFRLVAREPRIGLTLFAPGGLTEGMPLTSDFNLLGAFLRQADIFGPAGDEAWDLALERTVAGSKWVAQGQHSRRFIVLMSDEPITRAEFLRAYTLSVGAGKAGFKIYGVMIKPPGNTRNNPLSVPFNRTGGTVPGVPGDGKPKLPGAVPSRGAKSWQYYDDIADATGALAINVQVPQGGWGLGILPSGKSMGKNTKAVSPMAVAPLYPGGGPTNRVLTMVLRDAINPQYADRVEPFVKILVAYCQGYAKSPPEQRQWGTPNKMEPNYKGRPIPAAKQPTQAKPEAKQPGKNAGRTGAKNKKNGGKKKN